MPANAGIHGLPQRDKEKSWMPAFAGMTRGIAARWRTVAEPRSLPDRGQVRCTHVLSAQDLRGGVGKHLAAQRKVFVARVLGIVVADATDTRHE